MSKYSKIEWTTHTFNPWWGCVKVSPGCVNCYALTLAKRFGFTIWGTNTPRRFFGDAYWAEPIKWNAEAEKQNERHRVFCCSMADVFEDRRDLDVHRSRLWKLIEQTPSLDWLVLTKRTEVVKRLAPWGENWPANVWLGTSVENQKYADERLPYLLDIPAKVRFLSCEPLLGPVDLSQFIKTGKSFPIAWIIAGGESGPQSRPMNPQWVRSLRDFCEKNKVAFHFKQWGHWGPLNELVTRKCEVRTIGDIQMAAHGKAVNGRTLDGCIHDGYPVVGA
jgi:protein gp37